MCESNNRIRFAGLSDCIRSLVVLSPQRFVSVGNDGAISLWDVASGERVQSLESLFGHYLYA